MTSYNAQLLARLNGITNRELNLGGVFERLSGVKSFKFSYLLTPQKARRMFSPPTVCLLVNMITQKTNGSIFMKFDSMTDNDIGKNALNFGHDSEEILSLSRA